MQRGRMVSLQLLHLPALCGISRQPGHGLDMQGVCSCSKQSIEQCHTMGSETKMMHRGARGCGERGGQCLHETMHSILHCSAHAVRFTSLSPRYGTSSQFHLYLRAEKEKALIGGCGSTKRTNKPNTGTASSETRQCNHKHNSIRVLIKYHMLIADWLQRA